VTIHLLGFYFSVFSKTWSPLPFLLLCWSFRAFARVLFEDEVLVAVVLDLLCECCIFRLIASGFITGRSRLLLHYLVDALCFDHFEEKTSQGVDFTAVELRIVSADFNLDTSLLNFPDHCQIPIFSFTSSLAVLAENDLKVFCGKGIQQHYVVTFFNSCWGSALYFDSSSFFDFLNLNHVLR
jgi:hypothetical protein